MPRPGWGWGSPTETDQREVRLVRRQGGFKVLASSVHTLKSRSCVQVADSTLQSVCSFFGDGEDKRETEEAVRCDY